jgi:RNA polymerase sigma-70 factor (ECF subfamily)
VALGPALREGEGLSYEEIAETMDLNLGTVRSRLARARVALRDCIEGRS